MEKKSNSKNQKNQKEQTEKPETVLEKKKDKKASWILSAIGKTANWAFLISVVSAGISTCNRIDQNKQWSRLNLGRIVVKSVTFFTWRKIPYNAFDTIKWGYNDLMAAISQEDPNIFTISNSIVAFDLSKDSIVPNTYGITINEVEKQLQSRGIKNFSNYQFLKYYRINLQVENIGNTVAFLTKQKISYLDNGQLKVISSNKDTKSVNEHESTWAFFGLAVPLTLKLPYPFHCECELAYKDINGKECQKNYVLIHDDAGWKIEDKPTVD